MRRWVLTVVVAAVLTTACSSPDPHEVQTNSGGILDCRSDTVWYAAVSPNLGTPGAATPDGALSAPGSELAPPGEPTVESEATTRVVFVYLDAGGHRTGRVTVDRISNAGWYLTHVERCD